MAATGDVAADFKDVIGSGDIPVKSCPVESVFGTLDNTARSTLNGGTSVLVTKGRAMAQYNHAYATEEEAEKKANKRIRKKKGDSDREEDRSWAMTALYSTPIDVWGRVMEWYRKHISEFKEKEKRERHAAGRAKLSRQRKKKEDAAAVSSMNMALAFSRWSDHTVWQNKIRTPTLVYMSFD